MASLQIFRVAPLTRRSTKSSTGLATPPLVPLGRTPSGLFQCFQLGFFLLAAPCLFEKTRLVFARHALNGRGGFFVSGELGLIHLEKSDLSGDGYYKFSIPRSIHKIPIESDRSLRMRDEEKMVAVFFNLVQVIGVMGASEAPAILPSYYAKLDLVLHMPASSLPNKVRNSTI